MPASKVFLFAGVVHMSRLGMRSKSGMLCGLVGDCKVERFAIVTLCSLVSAPSVASHSTRCLSSPILDPREEVNAIGQYGTVGV